MWTIGTDAAWIKEGAQSYRHYCGARVAKNGRLWTAITIAGASIPGYGTALDAIKCLTKMHDSFWFFEQFGEMFGITRYGDVHHRIRPVGTGDEDEVFVFRASTEAEFPEFLKSILKRHF